MIKPNPFKDQSKPRPVPSRPVPSPVPFPPSSEHAGKTGPSAHFKKTHIRTKTRTIGSVLTHSMRLFYLQARLLFKNRGSVQITVQHSAITQTHKHLLTPLVKGLAHGIRAKKSVVSFYKQTPTTYSGATLQVQHLLAQVDE